MLDNVLHASMILLGIFLIVAYSRMQASLPNITITSEVSRAMEGLYTMGVMFLSVGLTLALLNHKHDDKEAAYVMYFVVLLGVVLTALAGILVSKTTGSARNWAIMVLVVGLLFIIGSGAVISREIYKKRSALASSFAYCSL